jgi:hypothetical protein
MLIFLSLVVFAKNVGGQIIYAARAMIWLFRRGMKEGGLKMTWSVLRRALPARCPAAKIDTWHVNP